MRQVTAKSARQFLEWLRDNEHHWASAEEVGYLVVGNSSCKMRAPAKILELTTGMYEPGDYRETGRMYVLTQAGHDFLGVSAQ